MNLKSSLFLLSIAIISSTLFSELPKNFNSLEKAVNNSNYDNCVYYLDRTQLTQSAKERLLELAARKHNECEMAYERRSHWLTRTIKFFVYGGTSVVTGGIATAASLTVSGVRLSSRFSRISISEQTGLAIAAAAGCTSLLTAIGTYNAVFGASKLNEKCAIAKSIKELIERKKAVA